MNAGAWFREVSAVAIEHGATVERTRSGHLRIVHPDGWFVITSGTPGDWRTLKNMRRDIRRAMRTAPHHAP